MLLVNLSRVKYIFLYLSAAIICASIVSSLFLLKTKPKRRFFYPSLSLASSKTLDALIENTASSVVISAGQRVLQPEEATTNHLTHSVASRKQIQNGLLHQKVAGGCEALDPKVLLYNRIFKTGSTTMMNLMHEVGVRMHYELHMGTTEDWYNTGKAYPYPGIIATEARQILKRNSRAAYAAHFYFRDDLTLQLSHAFINQVREPVVRVVSHYFHMRTNPHRPRERIEDMIRVGQFNETLEACLEGQHRGCENNIMTRFFCGVEPFCKTGSQKALARGINNINRYYVSVGLIDHFDDYLRILQKRLPKFFPSDAQQNVKAANVAPSHVTKHVSNKTLELIRKANWADIQLYEYISNLFWKQAKNCSA